MQAEGQWRFGWQRAEKRTRKNKEGETAPAKMGQGAAKKGRGWWEERERVGKVSNGWWRREKTRPASQSQPARARVG